jgi:hypothetical protein
LEEKEGGNGFNSPLKRKNYDLVSPQSSQSGGSQGGSQEMKMYPKKKFQKTSHPRVGTPIERPRINFGNPFEVSSPTTTTTTTTTVNNQGLVLSLDHYDEEDLEILKRIQEIKEEIKILDQREIEYLEIR